MACMHSASRTCQAALACQRILHVHSNTMAHYGHCPNRLQAKTAELWERFRASGPGLPSVPLPQGMEALHRFQDDLDSALKQREQLALAEKLFNMPITSYPQLAQVSL